MAPTPLAGIRVIDCTHVLAGPFSSYQLALMGADVIRVDRTDDSDFVRFHGPRPDLNEQGLGVGFLGQGANKQSIRLNLKHDDGKAIFRRLATSADVVVENFRPGKMDALGLGYKQLSALNPRIIYCSITGYGQRGPKRDAPVYDHVMQAVSGLMSLNGDADGPRRIGFPVIDYVTGLQASQAILAALVERQTRNAPRHLDVSMLEASLTIANTFVAEAMLTGKLRPRSPNQALSGSPFSGVFETTDGLLTVTANSVEQAHRLCTELGKPELADDPRIADWQAHPELADELAPFLSATYKADSALAWEERLNRAGVPAGKVRSLEETIGLEQLDALGSLPDAGTLGDTDEKVRVPGLGVRFDGESPPITRSPPVPGADTDTVLAALGIGEDEISRLRATGVVG
jgi:CoA:oxalate CoA-transferase